VQPLEHSQIIRPLRAQLGFELLVGHDALAIISFDNTSVIANVLIISSSSVSLSLFVFPAMIAA